MFKVMGENTLTGNLWICESGIESEKEAHAIRKGYQRLESDYKIVYFVQKES